MKRLVTMLAIAVPMLAQQAAPPVGDVTLAWTPSQPLGSNGIFILRGSPVLTGDSNQWVILTNVSGVSTQTTVRIVPGTFFFIVQASNLWGVFPPSNVEATPPVQSPPLLTIKAAK